MLFVDAGGDGLVSLVEVLFVFGEVSCLTNMVLGAAEAGFLLEGVRKKFATWGIPFRGLSSARCSSTKDWQLESMCELMFVSFTCLLHMGQSTMVSVAELEA